MKRRNFIQGLVGLFTVATVARVVPASSTTSPTSSDTVGSLRILRHPTGGKLGWKNPYYRMQKRDDGGQHWDGWEPVLWGGKIGQRLDWYLADPPTKPGHTHAFVGGGYIWHGDVFLCVKRAS